MARIAFFEANSNERRYFRRKLKDHQLTFFKEPLTAKNVEQASDADVVSVFIYSEIGREVIDKIPNLQLIATRSTGYDHIDTTYCFEKNIEVTTVPFYGENTVAEHTFALILSISRNVHKSYMRTLKGNYSIEGLTGFDLKGKTIGIVGAGHIGLNVAKMAKGFSMNVLVHDRQSQAFLAEVLGFEEVSFEDLLERSDIISLHVPYNKATHHMINNESIQKVKKGAIIINTARGGLIDTEALWWALKHKKISGAGLDVIEGEELIQEENQLLHEPEAAEKLKTIVRDQWIFKMDNVVFTPHNAFNSQEAIQRIQDTTIKNIKEYLEKGTCRYSALKKLQN
ncbi:MAG: hydroxyacid dehydrogenase [Chlamydiota bacterium]